MTTKGALVIAGVFAVLYAAVGFLFWYGSQTFVPLKTPREYLATQCEERGCDFALLDAIVTCESKWIMVQNSISSAYGYFQILDSTERTTPQYQSGRRKTNPYTNIDMGVFLYETRGTSPWNSSRTCWSARYSLTKN